MVTGRRHAGFYGAVEGPPPLRPAREEKLDMELVNFEKNKTSKPEKRNAGLHKVVEAPPRSHPKHDAGTFEAIPDPAESATDPAITEIRARIENMPDDE